MTLSDLPLEILSHVCAYLSDYEQFVQDHGHDEQHGDDDTEEYEVEGEENQMDGVRETEIQVKEMHHSQENVNNAAGMLKTDYGKKALLNLCLVSKQMQQIAENHLYSFFDGMHHNVGFFFRTLSLQPRYAAYVRGIRIEPLGERFSWTNFNKELGFEWTTSALCNLLHRSITVSEEFPCHLVYRIRPGDNASQQEIIAQWLILNLPKLELLRISIPEEWSFPFVDYIAKFDRSLLQHLHTLHILGLPKWQIFCASPALVRLSPVASLLGLPHLQDLCLEYCVDLDVDDNVANNARRIAHWKCGATTCQVGKLLSTCTKLQRYELEYFGGKALDLSYLSPSVESLQSLELEVHEFNPNLLTKYHSLKSIRITADLIRLRRPGSLPSVQLHQPPPPPPDTLLAKILPLGIEQICLGPTYLDATALWQSQLETLLDRDTVKFQDLNLIEICWQPSEKLQKLCSQASIELRAL